MNWDLFWSLFWVAVIVAFAIGEWASIRYNGKTLSHVVSVAAFNWPLLPYIYGILTGGLAVHFFWHYCPM
jgi:hypothetical protein